MVQCPPKSDAAENGATPQKNGAVGNGATPQKAVHPALVAESHGRADEFGTIHFQLYKIQPNV